PKTSSAVDTETSFCSRDLFSICPSILLSELTTFLLVYLTIKLTGGQKRSFWASSEGSERQLSALLGYWIGVLLICSTMYLLIFPLGVTTAFALRNKMPLLPMLCSCRDHVINER